MHPPPSPPPISFTPLQSAQLKCQVIAFKLLSRNQPIPTALQDALSAPAKALEFASRLPDGLEKVPTSEEQAAELKAEREKQLADEDGVETVEEQDSLVFPFNSYLSPSDMLRHYQSGTAQPSVRSTPGMTRPIVIPNLLPQGLDAQGLIDERNRFIQARIEQRKRELEALPSNLGNNDLSSLLPPSSSDNSTPQSLASAKLRALIELKSLNLLPLQTSLRQSALASLAPAVSLSTPLDRTQFRRARRVGATVRDAKQLEALEASQKRDREKRAKQKHLDHLTEIVSHGRDLQAAHRAHKAKFAKFGKTLLKFHADAEKEEQKRVERVSKERLKALRADDEEGYLKLIDTAKDTRITHLLRQTDTFLDSLAAAVLVQQKDGMADAAVVDGPDSAAAKAAATDDGSGGTAGDGAIDESRFGAQPVFADEVKDEKDKDKIDYYNVAHRIKETVTEQPSILVGGELKSYQIKGLEWMVSLYNNHVNGILADEMVRPSFPTSISPIPY